MGTTLRIAIAIFPAGATVVCGHRIGVLVAKSVVFIISWKNGTVCGRWWIITSLTIAFTVELAIYGISVGGRSAIITRVRTWRSKTAICGRWIIASGTVTGTIVVTAF